MTIAAVAPEMIEAPPNRAEPSTEEGSGSEETGFAAFLAQAAADDATPEEGEDPGRAPTDDLLTLLAPVEAEAEAEAAAAAAEVAAAAEAAPETELPLDGQVVVALSAPVAAATASAAAEVAEAEVPLEPQVLRVAEEAVREVRVARLGTADTSTPDETAPDAAQLADEALAPAPADETVTRATASDSAEAATRPVAEAPVPRQEVPVGTRPAAEGREVAAVATLTEANTQAQSDDSGASRDPGRGAGAATDLATVSSAEESGRAGGAFELPDELLFTPPTRSSEPASAQPLAPPPVVPGIGPVVASLTPTEAPAAPPSGAPAEALPVHVEWLTARGGGSARLQLHPANLGEVEVNVNVRGNAVDVVIRALEPAAQAAVAQTRELLADGLANQDLRMEQFEVRGAGDESGSRGSGQERERAALAGDFDNGSDAEDRTRGEGGGSARRDSSEPAAAPTLPPTHRGASGVDVHV